MVNEWVQMLTLSCSPSGVKRPGQVVEVSSDEARDLIAAGAAVPASADVAEKQREAIDDGADPSDVSAIDPMTKPPAETTDGQEGHEDPTPAKAGGQKKGGK